MNLLQITCRTGRAWLLFLLLLNAPALAQNLVINGDFSSGFSNWSSVGGRPDWTESGGRAQLGRDTDGDANTNEQETLTSANFTQGLVAGVRYIVTFRYGFSGDTTPNNELRVRIRSGSGPVTGVGLNANGRIFLEQDFTGSFSSGVLTFIPSVNYATAFIHFAGQNAAANNVNSVLWVDDVVVKVPELDSASALQPLLLILLMIYVFQHRRSRNLAGAA